MKSFFLTIATAIFLTGCSSPIMKTISFDSEPRGARVFATQGINENSAAGKNFIGTTPFQWTTEIEGDGTFKLAHDKIPFYGDYVQPVIVFTAELPTGTNNFPPKREVYRGRANFQRGDKAPDGIFFDFTKP